MCMGKLFIIKTKDNNNNNNQMKMKNNNNKGKNKQESGKDYVNEFDYQDLIAGKEALKPYISPCGKGDENILIFI